MTKCPMCGAKAMLSKDPLDNDERKMKKEIEKDGYVFFCIADKCESNPIHGFRVKISKLQKDRIMYDHNQEKDARRVEESRGIRL
jgi:hypothetical protein